MVKRKSIKSPTSDTRLQQNHASGHSRPMAVRRGTMEMTFSSRFRDTIRWHRRLRRTNRRQGRIRRREIVMGSTMGRPRIRDWTDTNRILLRLCDTIFEVDRPPTCSCNPSHVCFNSTDPSLKARVHLISIYLTGSKTAPAFGSHHHFVTRANTLYLLLSCARPPPCRNLWKTRGPPLPTLRFL